MRILITALFLFIFSSVISQNLQEDFNYPAGVLTAQGGGWNNFSGAINELSVTATGLVYPKYYSSAATNKIDLVNGKTEKVARSFTLINGGSAYLSFLINLPNTLGLTGTTTGDHFIELNNVTTSSNNSIGRVYIRKGTALNTFQLGLNFNSGSTVQWPGGAADNLALNQTHLVVMKYQIIAGSNGDDIASLFIDPVLPAAVEPAPVISVTNTPANGGDLSTLSAVMIRQGTNTGNISLDAINVTTSWNIILPLQLMSFRYEQSGKKIILNWSTSDEINTDRFEVERSFNAAVFSSIGEIAANNKSGKNDYQFIDFVQGALVYYRLKHIDKNGKFNYSKILAINNTGEDDFKIMANPASSQLLISHKKIVAGSVIHIVSSDGKIIQQYHPLTGATQSVIPVTDLNKGIYFLEMINGDSYSRAQFIH